MLTKKDFGAVLGAFCLAIVMVSVAPASRMSIVATGYNPWLDSNHDGKINLLDLVSVATSFGTAGDPALNVTVTNPIKVINPALNNNATEINVWYGMTVRDNFVESSSYDANGFGHLHVIAYYYSPTGTDNIVIEVRSNLYNSFHTGSVQILDYMTTLNVTFPSVAFSIPMPADNFSFLAYSTFGTDKNLYLSYYLTWA